LHTIQMPKHFQRKPQRGKAWEMRKGRSP
jgi:hypothetical protein